MFLMWKTTGGAGRQWFFCDKSTRLVREALHIFELMALEPTSHYSFIIRCWRDASGLLRGQLIDAVSQRSYPFASIEELTCRILNLVPAGEQAQGPETDHEETHGG